MTTVFTQEQLKKMKSSQLRELVLQLQKERNESDSLHEQSIRHLQLSFKEQADTQKEMITELLKSEENYKQQVEQLTQKYDQLKSQQIQRNAQVEMKNNNKSKNMNITFGGIQSMKLFIQESDLKNSCVVDDEEVKTNIEQQIIILNKSKEVTPIKQSCEQKSQNLTFSQQQNLLGSKQIKNSIQRSNDYLYKSIQSCNYIITPPPEYNTDNVQSFVETPEKIELPNQKCTNPTKIVIDNRLNALQQYKLNSKIQPSIIITEPKNNSNIQLEIPNISNQQTNQFLNVAESNYFTNGTNKKSKNPPPIFESRKTYQSLIVSDNFDAQNLGQNLFQGHTQGVHPNQGQYAPDILQSQYLYVSNANFPSGDNAKTGNIQKQNLKLGDLLFEDFFIIGPNISEMQDIAYNSPDTMNGTVQPEMFISFPGQQETNEQHQRKSLKTFCYPFNVQFKKHKIIELFQGKIFKPNVSKNSPNSFVFSMLGETDRCQDKSVLNPALLAANPHLSLYCICFTTENFITIPKTKGGKKEDEDCIYLVPITYSFLTYYPFVSHFLDIITEIANQSKIIRGDDYIKLLTQVDQQKCQYCLTQKNSVQPKKKETYLAPIQERISEQSTDGLSDSESSQRLHRGSYNLCCSCPKKEILSNILKLDIENEINIFYSGIFDNIREALKVSQLKVPDFQLDMKFKFRMGQQFTLKNYMVPAQNRIISIETEWGACLTMSCLALEDFLFILTAVALEKWIVFYSKNISLLTSSILTFYSILKPFTYVLPVVFNLPLELLNLLDSPVPLLIGINKDISYKSELENEGYEFFEKVVVDLDSSSIICQSQEIKEFIENHMPLFKSCQQEMIEKYFQINPQHSNQFKIFNSIRKKRNSLSLDHPNNYKSQDKLLYETNADQYNAMINFLENIRKCFDNYFLKHLPVKTDELVSQFNLKTITNLIEKKSKDDCDFIKEFTKTQSFTSYVEQIYISPD